MGRSQETFNKKEVQKNKEKKRKEKEKKRAERQSVDGNNLDNMIAYVDENGMITDTPPDPTRKTKISLDDIEISIPKGDKEPVDFTKKGVVTFFNESKGYGFIKEAGTNRNVFVHANGLTEQIKENNKVIFEVEKGPKGFNAINVKIDRE